MSNFEPFGLAVGAQAKAMADTQGTLYVAGNGYELWDIYINSFPEGTNPIHIARTEHDCSCCKNFIRNMGNVFAVVDGEIVTCWDVEAEYPYDVVAKACADYVRQAAIHGIFVTRERSYGAKHAGGWTHFHANVSGDAYKHNPETIRGDFTASYQVATRSLNDYSVPTVDTVLELINDNNLYRGAEYLGVLQAFRSIKVKFDQINDPKAKELFVLANVKTPGAQIRRNVIHTLLEDLKDGKELDKSVASFEAKVAPANYKRPKALVTKKMIDAALETIQKLDLEPSLARRHATVDDINTNDVIFIDSDSKEHLKGSLDTLRDGLYKSAKKTATATKGAEGISIHDFIENIVPKATTIEIQNGPGLFGNFVTMTAPVHDEAQPLFAWDNAFAWSYDGNMTDSSIREKVGRAGGNINAPFRVSLSWFNTDDLDLSCEMPNGQRIYFGNKQGILDVDMNVSNPRRDAVENLSWSNIVDGEYEIFVDNFTCRESIDTGYVLELFVNGETRQYRREGVVGRREFAIKVKIKNRTLVDVTVGNKLKLESATGVDKWNLSANDYHKVNLITTSPNFWGGKENGNKHWFFFVEGCKNPDPVRGVYNEYLRSDLHNDRRAFELLGSHTMIQPTDGPQLSGFGFSSTKAASAQVRVDGRPYTINF